jgi:hypothetical protein
MAVILKMKQDPIVTMQNDSATSITLVVVSIPLIFLLGSFCEVKSNKLLESGHDGRCNEVIFYVEVVPLED